MEIDDAFMRERLGRMRAYVLVIMRKGPAYESPEVRSAAQKAIIWEHGRRNMRFQAEGIMPLVGPVGGGDDLVGICVFSVPEDDVRRLMDDDGAVQAGVLAYEVMNWFAAPGDRLPG